MAGQLFNLSTIQPNSVYIQSSPWKLLLHPAVWNTVSKLCINCCNLSCIEKTWCLKMYEDSYSNICKCLHHIYRRKVNWNPTHDPSAYKSFKRNRITEIFFFRVFLGNLFSPLSPSPFLLLHFLMFNLAWYKKTECIKK